MLPLDGTVGGLASHAAADGNAAASGGDAPPTHFVADADLNENMRVDTGALTHRRPPSA